MNRKHLYHTLLITMPMCLPTMGHAASAEYPVRPVRIIAPYPAGSATDIVARTIAQKMTENWGQQVIVDNRSGAGGGIGTALAAKATPDGYTLVTSNSSSMGINASLYPKLPYDPLRDFAQISNLILTPQVLMTGPSAPFRSVKDFVAAAKDKPATINYASVGTGSTQHLTMEMFRTTAGIKINHIPFKGAPDAHVQILAGQIPIMFDAISTAAPQVKAGRMRGIGISILQRSPFLPDVPTIAESGFPGFEAIGWIGLAAPAGTPPAILDKLNAELVRIMNLPDVKERFNSIATPTETNTRAQFTAFVKSEIAKWGKAVRDSGAKVE
jgi:tripartite-type tricarboxylate transporter receptor subunit TctC